MQSSFKLRNSKWCSVSSLAIITYSSDKQMLRSYCAYAQADLSLCWSHIPHCWKFHALAHILLEYCISNGTHFFVFKILHTSYFTLKVRLVQSFQLSFILIILLYYRFIHFLFSNTPMKAKTVTTCSMRI